MVKSEFLTSVEISLMSTKLWDKGGFLNDWDLEPPEAAQC